MNECPIMMMAPLWDQMQSFGCPVSEVMGGFQRRVIGIYAGIRYRGFCQLFSAVLVGPCVVAALMDYISAAQSGMD